MRLNSAFPVMLAAGLISGANSSAVAGETQRFAADYAISFAGIPVARSSFRTQVTGTDLVMKGTLSTAGLAAAFDSTKGISEIEGTVTPEGVQTRSYKLDYKSGKNERVMQVRFKNGNVTATEISPPRKPNPNAVPVEPSQLNGVVDPFFASLIAAASPKELCNRTVKVFDGTTRMNLVMRLNGSEPFSTKGFKGEAIRCAVRYEPISGHRAASKSVRYMAEGERASISFASLPGTGLYAPVKATIKTRSGTVSIRATRFEQIAE